MANDINSELEFRERYSKLPPSEKEFWLPKEIFFLAKNVEKLTVTQDDINNRVRIIENNCRKVLCDVGIVDNPSPSTKVRSWVKHTAYGGVGVLGTGGGLLALVEAIKAFRALFGG